MRWLSTIFVFVCFAVKCAAATNFVNFETAPVHPIALSPNGALLAVCNLPDGRLELFDVLDSGLTHRVSISVGVDPVSVRFRNDDEIWVVNSISDSINVISVQSAAVEQIIQTRDGPADVVFAGSPERAFVSCPPENLVLKIVPETGLTEKAIAIKGERPKALATDAARTKVFAAILESGNGTTILAPRVTPLGHTPAAGPVDLPIGPYGGINPPPNSGTNFLPEIETPLLSNAPPRVGLIVKKQKDGRWLDDNNGDWTQFISGTNAALSGRVPGWDLPDHDVAVIDAQSAAVSYVDSLMTICFDVAVNPASGTVAVVGTEARNDLRFEPVLQSIFTRSELALAPLASAGHAAAPVIVDLNPHLNYKQRSLPLEVRKTSIGDPRGAIWNSAGDRIYVTGMGSDNIVMLNASGERLAEAELPEGPTGMAFDGSRNRVYVMSRFAASITTLDASTLAVLQSTRFFDPTPEVIRKGRPHFYNTVLNSGLGQASCESCHVDARFDRLAWDLGTQIGKIKAISVTNNFGGVPPAATNNFHPMKGPMVTQTLQDIIGHEPFHWRGDRNGLEDFNPTFEDLQGTDSELTPEEMQDFEDFLATIYLPPNRYRQFDNSLSRSIALPGEAALGRGFLDKGAPLPKGDAVSGLNFFLSVSATCSQCHSLPTGAGADKVFKNGRWTALPAGPKGEHHLALAAVERSELLPFKIPQLRNLPDKLGFSHEGMGTSGFGFFHDGRADSLTRFVQDSFGITNDGQTADLIAFLLSFSGSDLPLATSMVNPNIAPGEFSQDVSAATGRQILLTHDASDLNTFITRATASTGRLELIVSAPISGIERSWLFDTQSTRFRADRAGETITRDVLFQSVATNQPILFTLVPKGTGTRLALDRDSDGYFNFDEVEAGTDPADPASFPGAGPSFSEISAAEGKLTMHWSGTRGSYTLLWNDGLTNEDWRPLQTNLVSAGGVQRLDLEMKEQRGFYKLQANPPP